MNDLQPFRRQLEVALAQPVNDYYTFLSEQPVSGGLLRNLINRLALIRARSRLQSDLRTIIQDGHVAAAILGNDNQPLTAAQLRQVSRRIAESERYLSAYMKALPDMKQPAAVARITLYSAAIVQTASAAVSQGKPGLPVYPGDRSLACKGFCHCWLDWVSVPDGWNVFWRVDPEAEHCVDCIDLNKRWSPLRVRNGQIQDKAIQALHAEYILRKAASL